MSAGRFLIRFRLVALSAAFMGACLHQAAAQEDGAGRTSASERLEYPAPDCNDGTVSNCVARMLWDHDTMHLSAARQDVDSPKPAELCIPTRYLELWDDQAREISERTCNLKPGSLKAVGRYLGCLDTNTAGCERPELGVALEGGGSKSAPFALGVLAGLQRAGVLPHINVIASASGGTYGAYYYFARLLESAPDQQQPDAWFRDCMPWVYSSLFPSIDKDQDAPLLWCKERVTRQDASFRQEEGRNIRLVAGNRFHRQAPHLYQAYVGQDLFAPQQTLNERTNNPLAHDWLGAYATGAWLFSVQLISLPVHYVAHGVFSWPINLSPIGHAYRSGIERAYGHSPESWQRALEYEETHNTDTDPSLHTGTRYERDWTLKDLRTAYLARHDRCAIGQPCGFPQWILSTSSTAGRSLKGWITSPPKDSQRFSFELGPRGQGSGLLGFLDMPPEELTLRESVGASAAFADEEQRAVANPPWRGLVNFGIFALNMNWGTTVSNFNVSDHKRMLYNAMPWPLYGLPTYQGNKAPYIHLTDGGNVDNLGLFALLRRGTRNVVVSASTDDKSGSFPSLCKIKNELELELPTPIDAAAKPTGTGSVYQLHMPSLSKWEVVCNAALGAQEEAVWGKPVVRSLFCSRLGLDPSSTSCQSAYDDRVRMYSGYNVWDWPYPVLEGCVVRRGEKDGTATTHSSCSQARLENRLITRLLVIKPAISMRAHAYQTSAKDASTVAVRSCMSGNDGRIIDAMPGEPPTTPPPPRGMDLPCQALAYIQKTWTAEDRAAGKAPTFPQDNFVKQTINSSYTLFGAYYDLGRHYAAQIRMADDGLELPSPNDIPIEPVIRPNH